MVLLTMTSAMVEAIQEYERLDAKATDVQKQDEPSLDNPREGNPISHGQIISISRHLRLHSSSAYHLDSLLRGSKIYIPPAPPPPNPTSEYTALMDRLRINEESLAYSRLLSPQSLNPSAAMSRLSATPHAHHTPLPAASAPDVDTDDDATYAEISRQMALIVNVLVSIIACSVAIWMAARHWSTPSRLGLSMGGSGLVAVAEVVVYSGYVRRVKDAKVRGAKQVERKEIVNTWVFGGDESNDVQGTLVPGAGKARNDGVRSRKGRKG